MKRKINLVFAALALAVISVSAQHTLPKLNYAYADLEPFIDSVTMRIHYANHHGNYVKNLNDALAKYPDLKTKSISDLLKGFNELPADIKTTVRNNGGGHYNHTFFWSIITSPAKSKISQALNDTITKYYGSVDKLKDFFEKGVATTFGSTWVWLIRDPANGKLKIVSHNNQDNFLISAATKNYIPILAIDLWEHAYYLKYQNRRTDYVKAFWNVVNWDKVEELLKQK
jgi:Fe-Mn family superoxide dismutase